MLNNKWKKEQCMPVKKPLLEKEELKPHDNGAITLLKLIAMNNHCKNLGCDFFDCLGVCLSCTTVYFLCFAIYNQFAFMHKYPVYS